MATAEDVRMINVERPGVLPGSVVSTGEGRSLVDHNIEVHVTGDVSGQMAVGNNNLIVKADHGAIVNVLKDPPTIRRRTEPAAWRPRRIESLVGREREVAAAWSVLQAAQPFEFFADAGSGKTSVLRYLAYMPGGNAPDGVAWNDRQQESTADLLQLLFDAFYESSAPLKPTPGQLREYLRTIRALVILDDLNIPREQLDALMDSAPQCVFLLASNERNLWSAGKGEPLQGLSFNAATDLVVRTLERAFTADEQQVLERLWRVVKGRPLDLIQSAARVKDGESLSMVVEELERMDADLAVAARVRSLPESERRVLGLVLALDGGPVRLEHVTALCGRDAEGLVQSLVHKGLVDSTHGEARFPLAITALLKEAAGSEAWNAPITQYFAEWSQRETNRPAVLLLSWPALHAVLRLAVKAGESVVVFAAAKAIEKALALSGLWDAWESVLQQALRAAQQLGDRAGQAWALHQLGTRLICLEQVTAGAALLNQALAIRKSIGDKAGASATRHNLGPVSVIKSLAALVQSVGLKGVLLIAPIVLLLSAGAWIAAHALAAGVASLQPQQLDFQQVAVGSVAIRSATVTNTGEGELHVAAIQAAGAQATGDFSQTNNCASNLRPHQACQIRVEFHPTKAGLQQGALTVSESSTNSHAIGLKGTGVVGQVAFLPAKLDFGQLSRNSTSTIREVAVKNSGTVDVVVSRVTTTGDFAVVRSFLHSPATLRPGQSGVVGIQFRPSEPGTRSGILSITAAGVESSMVLAGTGGRGFQPASIDFGSQSLKLPSEPKTLTFPNDGSLPLTVDAVTATGDFTVQGPCTAPRASVPPSGACQLSVTFLPMVDGTRTGALTLTDSAGGSYRVPLKGDVLVPTPDAPKILDWGTLKSFTPVTMSLTIGNRGQGQLQVSSLQLDPSSDPGFSLQPNGCDSVRVPPGGTCSTIVTFDPRLSRSLTGFSGTVSISDNAPFPVQTVPLRAVGSAHLTLSPLALKFPGQATETRSGSQEVSVTNDGSLLTPLAIHVAGSSQFPYSTSCTADLVAGQSCHIDVAFVAPPVQGDTKGTLVVSDTQPSVSLSGTAVYAAMNVSPTVIDTFTPQNPRQLVVVINVGNVALVIKSIVLVNNPTYFSLESDCPTAKPLPPGFRCKIWVTFKPPPPGKSVVSYSATLAISANISNEVAGVTLVGRA